MSDIFDLTGNETPEEIDALLSKYDDFELTDESSDEEEETVVLGGSEAKDESTVDSNVESASTDDKSDSKGDSEVANDVDVNTGDADVKKVIKSKDGEHEIPFEVLERERQKNSELTDRLKELEGKGTEAEKLQRTIEARNKQLSNLGVEPEDLPEDFELTNEHLEKLVAEYPEIGKALIGVDNKYKSQISELENTVQKMAETRKTMTVNEAIASIPELDAMAAAGGDDWAKALEIDAKLSSDPEWQNKPLQERFQKVTNTLLAEKDSAQQLADEAAKQVINDESQKLPASPSEVGSSHSHQPSKEELMAGASTEDLMALFADMDDAELAKYI